MKKKLQQYKVIGFFIIFFSLSSYKSTSCRSALTVVSVVLVFSVSRQNTKTVARLFKIVEIHHYLLCFLKIPCSNQYGSFKSIIAISFLFFIKYFLFLRQSVLVGDIIILKLFTLLGKPKK